MLFAGGPMSARLMLRALSIFAAFLVDGAALAAQGRADDGPTILRNMSYLKPLVGTWNAVAEYYQKDGSVAYDVGTYKISYVLEGTYLEWDVELHDKDAVQLYKDKAGVYPNTFQRAGWDALALAVDAVKRSCTNSDRQKFRDALAQTKDFPLSTQGTVTWKNPPTGENVSPSAIVTQVTGPGTFNVVK